MILLCLSTYSTLSISPEWDVDMTCKKLVGALEAGRAVVGSWAAACSECRRATRSGTSSSYLVLGGGGRVSAAGPVNFFPGWVLQFGGSEMSSLLDAETPFQV